MRRGAEGGSGGGRLRSGAVRVVLVLADDPAADGGELRRIVESHLAAGGYDMDVIDLHVGDFNPAMTAAGRRAYHSGQPLVEPDVADFGPRVSAAEALVFVYRAGWTGLSPRLKGFVDRTFVPGVGFHLVDGSCGGDSPGCAGWWRWPCTSGLDTRCAATATADAASCCAPCG